MQYSYTMAQSLSKMATESVMSAADSRLQLDVPAGIFIAVDLPEGRGLVSTRRVPKGSRLLEDSPFCHVVSSKLHEELCCSCLRYSESELLRCSNCKYNHYCSRACQRKDWSVHKGECVGMATILPHQPTDTMRMVLRLMLKKKSFDRDPNTDSPWTFDLLCKHAELLSESKKEGFGFQITGIMKMCERNKYIRVENTREVFSVLCRLSCNTFSVLNTDMNPVGEGVYILPSFLNHSCQPNCTVVFDGLKMDVRSVVDIKPGQQLYISYTDLLDPPNKRQEVLRSTYYFSCHCQRCSVALCLDPLLTSVLCAKCQNVLLSNDKVPPLLGIHLCTCGESTEMVDTRAQRLSEEFDSLTKENQAKDKGRMERLISFQSRADKVLSPYHNLSIRIKEKIMDLAIDLCEWEVAFRVGSSLTQFYSLYLEPSPLHTLHLIKLLKLSQVLEESGADTLDLLHSVLKNLEITHGPTHSLLTAVQCMTQSSPSQCAVEN